jgi:N-acetylmuramoyl-L-alanine amidase
VKQAPLAVITNALMPAVLVEVGFVTNREEERILSQGEFQAQLAGAMARAIRDFFERYPPGQGETVSGPRQ